MSIDTTLLDASQLHSPSGTPANPSVPQQGAINSPAFSDYKLLIESFTKAVWEADAAGMVTADSPSWRACTGQSMAEMLGDGWAQAIHPDDRAGALRQWQQAVHDQTPVNAGFRLNTPGGEWPWVNLRATPVLNAEGQVSRWLAVVIDRTHESGSPADSEERRPTEVAMRRLEERTRIALEAAEMGTWEWNLLTDEVYWNEQHFRLFGMDLPRDGGRQQPLTPDDFMRHVHPDDLDRVKAELERTIREKSMYDTDFQALRDDGRPAWMHGHGRITAEVDGQPTRLSGVMFDITERIQTQEALRDSNERFRTLVQNLPDYAIFRIDPSGTITEWTEGAQRVKGYTADEVIGQNISLFYTPESLAAGELARELAEAAQTGRAEREGVRLRKDGSRVWINEIATAIREADGRLAGFTKISRDITVRKQAEEALRESQERLGIVMESITEHAIITTDTQGLITGWPAGARQLFGFTAEEAIGQPHHIIFTPEDRAAGVPEAEIATARQQGRSTDERYHVRKDGSRFYVSGVMSPIYNADNRLLGYVKVSRDLTERQRMEQALREADQRKDEFLAVLAHELRNPIAPIRNTLQLLTLTSGDNETIAPAVALMSRQVNHLVRLIDDLLDVSRISRGKIDLRREPLDFTALVQQAAEAVRPLYVSTQCRLHLALPATPIRLNGDATRLTQVVTNLLTNGARYTLRNGEVWLSLEAVGGEAVLRVKDNGIGLTSEQLSAIFEMFVQADNSLSRSQGGLGLGLTLVEKLVELHGGRVEARSAGLGQGSEFVVFLPLLPSSEPSMPAESEKNQAPPLPRRLLVVDDNRDAADTLAMLLKLKKNEVYTRYSGREALEAIESLQPQLALLDISMPEMDGYETCRRIRQQPWGQSMVLIALTGYGQSEDKQRSKAAGFDDHLVKPVDLPVLLQAIDEWLPNSNTNKA